ncbi:MAG: DUF159 family protein [Rhodothalassiaceae bacterium]|nr:MAG: DUF159 family protein [Rhodothalassiaceae bacterium]
MCGRFLLTSPAEAIRRRFGVEAAGLDLRPRYNIAPGQDILVVHAADGGRRAAPMRWGLMPAWLSEPPGRPLINARIETVAERPAFRAAFRRRRCLVPADGWYEWQPQAKGPKQPFAFIPRAARDRPFAFAGIYEEPHAARWGEELPATVAILTMPAWPVFAAIHDRMPVPLAPEGFAAWLDPGAPPPPPLLPQLPLLPAEAFAVRPVSRLVNRVEIDSPAILETAETPAARGRPPGTQGDLFG